MILKLDDKAGAERRRFYRFRPLKRLLGPEGELATQTIFFPHPKYLNDPMEGYADIFWKGDHVLWKNLFRHYLRVFSNCFLFSRLTKDVESLEKVNYFMMHFTQHFATEDARLLFEEISTLFFSCGAVDKLVNVLASRRTECTEEEVFFHLETIHDLAYSATLDVMQKRGLLPPSVERFKDLALRFSNDFAEELYEKIDSAGKDSILQSIFAAAKHFGESRNTYLDDLPAEGNDMIRLFVREFPSVFLREIRRLIYPQWYAACFMGDYRNASVWGTYGDNYSGVCLIFNADVANGEPGIELLKKDWQGARKNPDGSIVERSGCNYSRMQFHKIDYVAKHVKVDFFNSLGRLPVPVLDTDWYSFSGVFSAVAKVDDSDDFRSGYWDSFRRSITKKLNDWSHEDEHRLLLYGMELDFSNKEDRLLKYRFEDLEGIIFGMRTPPDKRREIVSMIQEKCEAVGRPGFSFYQSYYSSDSGKIEMVPIPIFRGLKQK